jgi:hypothetical protein
MQTQMRVRRKVNDFASFELSLEEEEMIETGGITFSDGSCIELIKSDEGALILLDSQNGERKERIEVAGQTYVPPILSHSVLEALTLPTKRSDSGSTEEMFAEIYKYFLGYGTSEAAAQACAYFAFASWFPESLPVAPCLVLTGTESEAHILLQLLSCVVRHALPLAEISMGTFRYIPLHVQPTMLISYVHSSMWRLFSASNRPRTYVPSKNGLIDLFCPKAAYAGSTPWGIGGDSILIIDCTLNARKLPIINTAKLESIAAHLQPKLLDYRFKHARHVQVSDFDVRTLPIPLRILAQTLGSCIINAAELRNGIVRLLEGHGEEMRGNRLLDPNYVAIEALFTYCHGERGPLRVGVGEIASMATGIMADRGETAVFEPKKMGSLLRLLGFHARRDSKGIAIHLTVDVRRLIHSLARDHEVGDWRLTVTGCSHCSELTSA